MDTPAAEQIVQVPPRPSWARPDIHRRFWMAVSRASERERLPDEVLTESHDDEEGDLEGGAAATVGDPDGLGVGSSVL